MDTKIQRFQIGMRLWALACAVLSTSLPASLGAGTAVANRPWTVDDSVKIRHYVTNQKLPQFWSNGVSNSKPDEYRIVAPDGQHFFFVTQYGDLDADLSRYELWVYGAGQLREAADRAELPARGVQPLCRIERTCRSVGAYEGFNDGAIREARWVSNSEILFVEAGRPKWERSISLLNIATGEVTRLTDPKHKYLAVAFQYQSGSLLYRADDYETRPEARRYPMQWVQLNDQRSLFGIPEILPRMIHVVSRYRGSVPKVALEYTYPYELKTTVGPSILSNPPLSRDGRWSVVTMPAWDTAASNGDPDRVKLPPEWENYAGLSGPLSEDALKRLWKYVLIDMEKGTSRVMLDSPRGPPARALDPRTPQVLLTADNQHALLVNVSLPLTESLEERRHTGYLVDYNVMTQKWSALEAIESSESKVRQVGWVKEGEELLVLRMDSQGKPLPGHRYTLIGERWKQEEVPSDLRVLTSNEVAPAQLPSDIKIELRESANDPQQMVAIVGDKEFALLPPDPALVGVRRLPVQEFTWIDQDGQPVSAALLLPEHRSRPIPLVIFYSVLSNWKDYFQPDGPGSTAFAAQALAAQGIGVLYMPPYKAAADARKRGFWNEARKRLIEVDLAVKKLAEERTVDPKRVGLIGFSFTGYETYYGVTHPANVTLAAAIVADSFARGYGDYIMDWVANTANILEGGSRFIPNDPGYGGKFWWSKQTWVEQAPSFNMEKVETPVLFTHNSFHPIQPLESMRAFELSGREAAVAIFPDGGHQLTAPHQRQASLQLTVDWMNFWLQGREDADPAKKQQYDHWRKLKAQRDARWAKEGNPYDKVAKSAAEKSTDEVLKTPPPPKGKWVFQPDPVQPEWHPPTETKPAAGSEDSSVPEASKENPSQSKPASEPAVKTQEPVATGKN